MSQKYIGGFITKSPPALTGSAASGMWTLDQAMQLKKQGLWPPNVPGAPTIGTATATGFTTATVVYTAPAGDGGSPITLYTATSSPGGVTGTLSQAGSGTITVSGLTANTSYTFTVTATNAIGTSAASAASNSITTLAVPTIIGQAFAGGYYAGQIGVSSVATNYLVVGPVASAQANKQWKTTNTATSGTNDIDGPANTALMDNASHPAAEFCAGLTIGGYSDWYMPAKNELEVNYYNLKPTTTSNYTLSGNGINPNAVPARGGAYTAGTPPRTSAAAFQSGGAEAYAGAGNDHYWSSTQGASANYAYLQLFYNGQQGAFRSKTYAAGFVRAIRRVAV
jgi:hypothetical protein